MVWWAVTSLINVFVWECMLSLPLYPESYNANREYMVQVGVYAAKLQYDPNRRGIRLW